MADESDDRAAEREVLTNLPRTRPARRSTRRATAAPTDPEPAAAPKPARRAPAKRAAPAKAAAAKPETAAKRSPAKRSPAKPPTARRAQPKVVVAPPVDAPAAKARTEAAAPAATTQPTPPLPPSYDAHRSPVTDLAVTTIEFTGELMRIGMDLTRSIVRATLGRVPRP